MDSKSRVIMAGVVIVIIAIGAVGAYIVIYNPFAPTTTTTTPGDEYTLHILTRHSVAIQNVYETEFLATSYAINNSITDIEWQDPWDSEWPDILDAGWADVVWGGGPTVFDNLIEDEYLEPLTSTLMAAASGRVPDTYAGIDLKRESEGDLMWVSAAVSSFGITVNDYFLDMYDLPNGTVIANWTDLAGYEFGQYLPLLPTVALANAPRSSSNRRCYEIMTQGYGWDEGWSYLTRIAGNGLMPGGSSDVKAAVDNGAVGAAMSIDFYGYQSARDRPGIVSYITPEDYTIVNGDPIAIASTSTQKDLAEVFVNWVLSAEGQAVWLNPECLRIPVIAAAFDEPIQDAELHALLLQAFNDMDETGGFDFNDTLSAITSYAYRYYFEAVLHDVQAELVDCWSTIVQARYDGILDDAGVETYADMMAAMLNAAAINGTYGFTGGEFDLDKAIELNSGIKYDSTVKAHFKSEWSAAAIAQYASVKAAVLALYP